MKYFLMVFLLINQLVFANTKLMDIDKYFANKDGCFILYDFNKGKVITKYNPKRCLMRVSPNSTFKIPLSLMAFDKKIINQQTVFKWNGQKYDLEKWNMDQTPQTWLKNSVLWVSREITPKLGLITIKSYLQKFNYGNKDFSGDKGKNNPLTQAWLSSSLKISATEQLTFLNKMLKYKLPVSKKNAIYNTMNNMYLEDLANGWQLYGKTGSGYKDGYRNGWFVGFIVKNNYKYIFVTNFSDKYSGKDNIAGGRIARDITEHILLMDMK
ncbi:MAG TPA: penicillin-binding transpeptidase domain-containing protein [Burkholderiales bacterium]|nr:penicillin-binding transpeptidase domain-containing protein [Burkholderiales bacterium]